jgi:hypothetical protein
LNRPTGREPLPRLTYPLLTAMVLLFGTCVTRLYSVNSTITAAESKISADWQVEVAKQCARYSRTWKSASEGVLRQRGPFHDILVIAASGELLGHDAITTVPPECMVDPLQFGLPKDVAASNPVTAHYVALTSYIRITVGKYTDGSWAGFWSARARVFSTKSGDLVGLYEISGSAPPTRIGNHTFPESEFSYVSDRIFEFLTGK